MTLQKICLVLPSLTSGGMERVMTELANYFAVHKAGLSVHLIVLSGGEKFYDTDPSIIIHEPSFDYKKYSRPVFTLKILRFLRERLKTIQPDAVLSFGGRYNAFVLAASLGLGLRVFVSDRSRPDISYGPFLDVINPVLYKKAHGIVAQTGIAKNILEKKTGNRNIRVIGNPIRQMAKGDGKRENIILNVGRFIRSKKQAQLLEIFSGVPHEDWKLVFLGDGAHVEEARLKAEELGMLDHVTFAGNQKNISEYYNKARIFAFTSVSEGFPNVLGEAMSAGMACISYDCVAGPAELIDDGRNGFLVKVDDVQGYREKLGRLMEEDQLRLSFGELGREKALKFGIGIIAEEYYLFLSDKPSGLETAR